MQTQVYKSPACLHIIHCCILEPDEHSGNGRKKRLYVMYVEHLGNILLIICELAATVNKNEIHKW